MDYYNLRFFGGTFVITMDEKITAELSAAHFANRICTWPASANQKDVYMRKLADGRYEPVIDGGRLFTKEEKERALMYIDQNADMEAALQEVGMSNSGINGYNFSDL